MKTRHFFTGLVFLTLALWIAPSAGAEYILPYPSVMPGNKLYKVSRIVDKVKKWWYWGNIASFKYHLSLSDKYLVEAKTLFEYKQYLLAVDALKRSDQEFTLLPEFLQRAAREGKNATILEKTLIEAALMHTEVLNRLASELPTTFEWKPEKADAQILPLAQILNSSRQIRNSMSSASQ